MKPRKKEWYPRVLTEDSTLDRALNGMSISRFGDGELRMCLGGNCSAQVRNPKLAAEMMEILRKPVNNLLVCIPNCFSDPPSPKYSKTWYAYTGRKYTELYNLDTYGSSFITRPDSAPWIDTPAYDHKMRALWEGKVVTLVAGGHRSLTPDMLERYGAGVVRHIDAPERDAYADIDNIEVAVGNPNHTVLICLGPTATVLAARLARKGVHAVDIGHVGMFMRRKEAANARPDQSGVQGAVAGTL